MAKIAINMVSTEQGTGRKIQKTLTDINPNATSDDIKQFVTALNGLTTNIYGETNRIEKLNIDTEKSLGTITVTWNTEESPGEYIGYCKLLKEATEEFIAEKVKLFVDGVPQNTAELNIDNNAGCVIYYDETGEDLPQVSLVLIVDGYAGYWIKE